MPKSNADIATFYETLFGDEHNILRDFCPRGYQIFYNNRKKVGPKLSGGVCIFWRTRDCVKATQLHVENSKDNYDICAMLIDNLITGSKTIVIATYMMNLTAGREAQYTDYRYYLKAKKKEWRAMWPNVKFIITGDFNLGKEFVGKGLPVISKNYNVQWVRTWLDKMEENFGVVQRNTVINSKSKVLELLFMPIEFVCDTEAASFEIIPAKKHHPPAVCKVRNFHRG